MSIDSFFQIIEAIAVSFGVAFALIEWRQHSRRHEREAALELLHSFQTPEFAKALLLVYELPDELLSKKDIEEHLGEDMHIVYALTTTWESIGVLVFKGEISLSLVSDFFSGPIKISWQKLQKYYIEQREQHQRETIGEWFQWLAERLAEREQTAGRIPAHVAHRNWAPR